MIEVYCRTNLDLWEEWPTKLPAVPNVGDLIQSSLIHSGGFQLALQVVRVTWKCSNTRNDRGEYTWKPEIELHMSDFHKGLPCLSGNGETGSIVAFYEWYAPLVGKSVSSFI